jgi:hypothetical protein
MVMMMMLVALQAHAARNIGTAGIANDPARNQADWPRDESARERAAGTIDKPFLRLCCRRHQGNGANAKKERDNLVHEGLLFRGPRLS